MAFKMKGHTLPGPYQKKGDPEKELMKEEIRAAMDNAMPTAEINLDESISDNTRKYLGKMSGKTAAERKAMQKERLGVYQHSDDGTGSPGRIRSTDEAAENLRAVNSAAEIIHRGDGNYGQNWATREDKRTTTVQRKSPAKMKKSAAKKKKKY